MSWTDCDGNHDMGVAREQEWEREREREREREQEQEQERKREHKSEEVEGVVGSCQMT